MKKLSQGHGNEGSNSYKFEKATRIYQNAMSFFIIKFKSVNFHRKIPISRRLACSKSFTDDEIDLGQVYISRDPLLLSMADFQWQKSMAF